VASYVSCWLLEKHELAIGFVTSGSLSGCRPTVRRPVQVSLKVESRIQTVAFLLPAQNISHYTISLGNVGDSLDARAASNRLYKEGLEVWSGWLGACCSGSGSNFWHDKNCHSVENSGHAV